jgi:hypothetical protein
LLGGEREAQGRENDHEAHRNAPFWGHCAGKMRLKELQKGFGNPDSGFREDEMAPDAGGDLAGGGREVAGGGLEGFGPDQFAGVDVGEAGGDSDGVAGGLQSAFEDDIEAEDAGHDGRGDGEAAVTGYGGGGDDAHSAGANEFGDDLFIEGGGETSREGGFEGFEGEDGDLGHPLAGREVAGGEVELPPDEGGEYEQGGGGEPQAGFTGRGSGGGGEAVAAFGDGFDVAGGVTVVAEGFAEDGDIAGEADFLDGGVGPDQVEEGGFVHDLSAAFEQDVEGVDGFGDEGDGLAVTKELALGRVVAEGAEFVEVSAGHGLIV